MKPIHYICPLRTLVLGTTAILLLAGALHAEDAWWNKSWPERQKVTLDSSGVSDEIGSSTVLIRLSDANFQFDSAREDGSDMRFVATDGKAMLPYQIESYDNLLHEAFVWVRMPEMKAGAKASCYLYYGNQDPSLKAATKPTDAYDNDYDAVFHFAERGAAPADSTVNANKAETISTAADGALIGRGLRLLGSTPIIIPASSSLDWKQGQPITISMWIKPTALQQNAVLVSRTAGKTSFRLLLDQGVPVIELAAGAAPLRSQPSAPLAANTWSHITLVAHDGKIQWYVNGEPYTAMEGAIPAIKTPLVLGGMETDIAGVQGYIGELDELQISHVARPAGWIKLASVNQGASEASQHSVSLGAVEGGKQEKESRLMEHLSLFKDIASNMMFDGWTAIGVCAIMIIVGWTVALRKLFYLNTIEKANTEFQKAWKTLSTDLTALDHQEDSGIPSLLGNRGADGEALLLKSPLYHIYHIGSSEIEHRVGRLKENSEGLPGRSIQAIRASLDAGLVHETHRLTDGLVFLTISIAGGPYVGLLGTVLGVMITFAIIARSGEVNVNSIAPGIASALLATVVGLVVAIPALFIYSYLNARIKNALALMQVFIDEFVAKMAEFYRPRTNIDSTSENGGH
jgi:biopolymer transport protein ExbB